MSSVAFTRTKFELNPANNACFPWLSNIALNYEEWRPKAIVFQFKTLSSDVAVGATTGGLGSVIMATQYNSTATEFYSKPQMQQYEGSVSGKPSITFNHYVKCGGRSRGMKWYYTREPGNQAPGGDQRFYDIGEFTIATVGNLPSANPVTIGELWVSYEIEFTKPKIGLQGLVDTFAYMDDFMPADTDANAMSQKEVFGSLAVIGATKFDAFTTGNVFNTGGGFITHPTSAPVEVNYSNGGFTSTISPAVINRNYYFAPGWQQGQRFLCRYFFDSGGFVPAGLASIQDWSLNCGTNVKRIYTVGGVDQCAYATVPAGMTNVIPFTVTFYVELNDDVSQETQSASFIKPYANNAVTTWNGNQWRFQVIALPSVNSSIIAISTGNRPA